jgi:DNA polymerase-3 subunit gamma/tau
MKADPEGLRADLSPELFAALQEQTGALSTDRLLELIEQFAAAETRMKWAPNKKLHFEIAIIKAVQTLEQATLSEILDALTAIRSGGELPVRAILGDKPVAPRPAPRKATPVEPAPIARPARPEGSGSSSSGSSRAEGQVRPQADSGLAAEPEPTLLPEAAPIVSETPEPTPAAAPRPPVDINTLWTDVLVAVRRDRPLITTWLEAGMLLDVTGGAVLLGFPPEQKLAMESLLRANNRTFLESLFTQLTGETLSLQCETREGLQIEPVNVPAQVQADPMEEFKNDPLIRKALEIFKAEIQPA